MKTSSPPRPSTGPWTKQPTVAQHSFSDRTRAVADAHVVLRLVVISLFALAVAVAVRGARPLHHLVLAAHIAAEALADVVPQLREGARGTRRALALLRRRAACAQVGARRAAVALQRRARHPVGVFEGEGRRGDAVNPSGAQRQQQHHRREEGKQHLEEGGNRRGRC